MREAAAAALARGVPVGAGGSRLLRGNHAEHEALEREAAAFFGAESALLFGAGFSANAALLATLPQRGDLIVHDALVHASAHDGHAPLARAERRRPHNDADGLRGGDRSHFDAAAERAGPSSSSRASTAWTAISRRSTTLAALAERHEAFLLIDEAHATGVYGPGGRGLAAALEGRENVVTLHTCGKALGMFGALALMPRVLREFLINRCRPSSSPRRRRRCRRLPARGSADRRAARNDAAPRCAARVARRRA